MRATGARVLRLEPELKASLAIIQGTDSYSSPSWYAAKAEHGRVVPT
ncbi:FMN-binding negative transcriptional regulator [Arthrobacter psychrochitiniphilus]